MSLAIYGFSQFVNPPLNEITIIVNMEMTKSEQKFAMAALAMFQRFGVRKATMEEIAAEAGVSKPTLYATFRNKDAALAGSIRLAKGAAVTAVRDAWKGADDLGQKLDLFFDRLVVAGFDMLHSAPDANAFDTAIGEASKAAIRDTRAAEKALVTEALMDRPLIGTTPEAYADFIVTAAMQAKRQSESREDLLAFLAELKRSVLVVAG